VHHYPSPSRGTTIPPSPRTCCGRHTRRHVKPTPRRVCVRGVPVDYVTAESRAYGPSVNQTLATEWHHTIVDSPVRRWTWRIAADLLSQTKNNLCAPSFHSQGDRFSQAEDCFTTQARVTNPGTNRGEVSPSTGFRRVMGVTSYPVIPITTSSQPLQTAHSMCPGAKPRHLTRFGMVFAPSCWQRAAHNEFIKRQREGEKE